MSKALEAFDMALTYRSPSGRVYVDVGPTREYIIELEQRVKELEFECQSPCEDLINAEAALYPQPDDGTVSRYSWRERAEQAEAEAERLKCCGNCTKLVDNNATLWPCREDGFVRPTGDGCYLTPSRWEARDE